MSLERYVRDLSQGRPAALSKGDVELTDLVLQSLEDTRFLLGTVLSTRGRHQGIVRNGYSSGYIAVLFFSAAILSTFHSLNGLNGREEAVSGIHLQ